MKEIEIVSKAKIYGYEELSENDRELVEQANDELSLIEDYYRGAFSNCVIV